ncbi:hypothetical protein RCL1_005342 [Eukaryota sp. TZLM3-RCL]
MYDIETLIDCSDLVDPKIFIDSALHQVVICSKSSHGTLLYTTYIRQGTPSPIVGPVKLNIDSSRIIKASVSLDRTFLITISNDNGAFSILLAFLSSTIVSKLLSVSHKSFKDASFLDCFWLTLTTFAVVSTNGTVVFSIKLPSKHDVKVFKYYPFPSLWCCFDFGSLILLLGSSTDPSLVLPLILNAEEGVKKLGVITNETVVNKNDICFVQLSSVEGFLISYSNSLKLFKFNLSGDHEFISEIVLNHNEACNFFTFVNDIILIFDFLNNSIYFYSLHSLDCLTRVAKCPIKFDWLSNFDLLSNQSGICSNLLILNSSLLNFSLNYSSICPPTDPVISLKYLQQQNGSINQIIDLLSCHLSYLSDLSQSAEIFDSIAFYLAHHQSMSPLFFEETPFVGNFVSSIIGYVLLHSDLPTTSPLASFHSIEVDSLAGSTVEDSLSTVSEYLSDPSVKSLSNLLRKRVSISGNCLSHEDIHSKVPILLRGSKGTVINQEILIVSVFDPLMSTIDQSTRAHLSYLSSCLIELIRALKVNNIRPLINFTQYLLKLLVKLKDFNKIYSLTESKTIIFDFFLSEYLLKLSIEAGFNSLDSYFSRFLLSLLIQNCKKSQTLIEKVINHLISIKEISTALFFLQSLGISVVNPRTLLVAALETNDILLFVTTFNYLVDSNSSKFFNNSDKESFVTAKVKAVRMLRENNCSDFVDFYYDSICCKLE